MMQKNWRFFVACGVVMVAIGALIFSAVNASAKSVVTVRQLVMMAKPRQSIRVGARVAEGPIESVTGEHPQIKFFVRDPEPQKYDGAKAPAGPPLIGDPSTFAAAAVIEVTYDGLLPDTLKPGRDVIIEGHFDGKRFMAKNLLTQCPSKYRPPVPEGMQ